MSDSEHNAAEIIQAYRKRRQRMVPMLLGGLAVVLLVVGLFLVVLWVTGENPPQLPALLATKTPTATQTATPVPPTATPTVTITPPPTETPTPSGPRTYVIEEGDTLSSIAEQFEVDVLLLMSVNNIEDPNALFVGQEITIPSPDQELPTPTALPATLLPGQEVEYVVQPGDSLQTIAAQFNSTAEAIAERNEIEDPNAIYVGQKLIVPVGIATPTPTVTENPNTATPTPLP